MNSRRKPPSEAQLASNRYVMMILLKTGAALILQRYRFWWRRKLVFKRLKPLFGYNRIPSKVEALEKAQVYGKLLLAVFRETWANKARFSP